MAYDPHLLVTFGGTLTEVASLDEIWQCGIRCSFTPEEFDEHLYVSEIADNLAAWFTSANAKHSAVSRLTWLKAARIMADGNYPSDTYEAPEALYGSPVGGGGASVGMPSFCSIAYSWRSSDHARGPASHGRIYPPNYGVPCSAGTSIVDGSVTAGLVTAAQALLAAVQNADGTQIVSPGIFSKLGVSSVITSVKVGNVVDTQHRRREKIAETYAAGAFPA